MQLGPGRLPGPNFFPQGERNRRLGGVYQIESGLEGGGCRLSPQRNFSPAPLGNPIAPSSVTFGDSSPPRGSLRVVQLYTKKRPKSGHADGHRNSPSTGTMRPTTPKPASGNERAINPGVQGACPRPSFSPFLGRNGDPAGQAGPRGAAPRGTEKAATTRRVRSTLPLPRPGPGGKDHAAGANLRRSKPGPPADSKAPTPVEISTFLSGVPRFTIWT